MLTVCHFQVLWTTWSCSMERPRNWSWAWRMWSHPWNRMKSTSWGSLTISTIQNLGCTWMQVCREWEVDNSILIQKKIWKIVDAVFKKSTPLCDELMQMKKNSCTLSSKLYVVFLSPANTMREEFSFGHTLDSKIRDAYKTNPQTVLVFTPERYYTKFEPKWHVMKLVRELK